MARSVAFGPIEPVIMSTVSRVSKSAPGTCATSSCIHPTVAARPSVASIPSKDSRDELR